MFSSMRKISLRDGADDLADGPGNRHEPQWSDLDGRAISAASQEAEIAGYPERLVRPRLRAIPSVTRLFGSQARRARFYLGSALPVEEDQRQGVRAGSPGYRNPVEAISTSRIWDPQTAWTFALAALAISGMKQDKLEIRPGLSNVLKFLSRLALGFALNLCRPDRSGFARSDRTEIDGSKKLLKTSCFRGFCLVAGRRNQRYRHSLMVAV